MMKKLLALLLALTMVFAFAACTTDEGNDEENNGEANNGETNGEGTESALKIGVILLHDESIGYDFAHMQGIRTACETLGIDWNDNNQVIWKYNIGEDESCHSAAVDLVDQGCNVIISDSYGHQSYMTLAASENPDVQFLIATGDTAAVDPYDNTHNFFTHTFESRYVSGVVGGMKLAEMIEEGVLTEDNYNEDGTIKIGYVGAYPYAEVVSGYTAFYLGVKSVVDNVKMDVTYTNSWADATAEQQAAEALLARGCCLISQHADSTGGPAAIEAAVQNGAVCYYVGYNIDMLSVAPTAALTSAQNNWSVLYRDTLEKFINGEEIPVDFAVGASEDAVMISKLGPECAEGTQEAVDAAWAGIKDGSLKVFDTSKFTCQPSTDGSYQVDADGHVTSAFGLDSDGDYVNDTGEAIVDGAFQESVLRSAPYFSLRIDGITELNNN